MIEENEIEDSNGTMEHYWKKNSGAGDNNYLRNKLLDHSTDHMKTYSTLIKTYHIPANRDYWSTRKRKRMEASVMCNDVFPCITYSMNKKERWEMEDNIGPDMIEDMRKLHDYMDVVLLERVFLDRYPNFGCSSVRWLECSRIGVIHCLEDCAGEKPRYHKKTAPGRGQSYPSIVPKKTVDDTLVPFNNDRPTIAYHFMKAPQNYQKFLQKRYTSKSFGWDAPHIRYWRRKEAMQLELYELRYGDFGFDLFEYYYGDDSDYNFDDTEPEEKDEPRKFYDIFDHFVDNYVFVKGHGKS